MTQLDIAAITAAVQAVLASKAPKAAVKTKGGKKIKAKKGGRKPLTDAEKAVFIAKNDAEAVKAFAERGIKDVKPRENVLTYNKWIEKGRIVKRGEKSVQIGPFRLFHESQTEPVQPVIGA